MLHESVSSDLFEAAAVAPVVITRHHKPRFVIMSVEHYEALLRKQQGIEDVPEKGSSS
ncbi:type II toxin-antitoxin system Phd/YefM family antitoxin [Gluconacetobacter entanii]|uniref:Antitoxin n=1 Tax=Gluconacetobacter entanii TaxID=108528 RepID=A0ABT3K1K4_9PROT|nr:type II toxin-antitoxin system prevent-host-death family antitoxin [Gluconacetobacter entanii]MCW4589284.1 type II toxin-antitoxin system Phd/YefM family antitoxin [Gluconacetobacter entanii]MCW4592879.1 type II toxin-antitoxin system Phd/YefM family antitoxin [Gluconacetobacter entanii]NPC90378.1 type II toxin-antitoxin system Phd/YefM family antitoxin [Gluconacetobacter entanii]